MSTYTNRSDQGFPDGPYAGIGYTSRVTHFGTGDTTRSRSEVAYDCGCRIITHTEARPGIDLIRYDPSDRTVWCLLHAPSKATRKTPTREGES